MRGAAGPLRADDVDRMLVRLEVTICVLERARALAEHVEGAQRHLRLARAALERFLDGAADHELAADDAHGAAYRQAHQRLARLARQLAHPAGRVRLDGRIQIQNPARQHQAPGRGIDEQGFGSARVRRPVPGRELFGDQPVRGGVVRDAQQRLGDAHERDALLIRQPEFLQERIQERPLVAPRPRALDQRHAQRHGTMARPAGELQPVQQSIDRLVLGPQGMLPGRRPRRLGEGGGEDAVGSDHAGWRPWRRSSEAIRKCGR